MPAHLQARIWSPAAGEVLTDEQNWPIAGELYYDPTRRCFGIYSGTGNTVDWLPHLDASFLRLRRGQRLSGRDNASNNHALYLDFDAPGEIQVKLVADDSIVLRINASGIVGVTSPPRSNLLANAGLAVRRTFVAPPPNTKVALLAPNWQAWTSTPNSQIFAVFDTDTPAGLGADASLAVRSDPFAPPPNCGLRLALHDLLPFAGQTLTAAAYYKGPQGEVATQRCLNNNRLYSSTAITGTGAWQRSTMTFAVPAASVLLNEDPFLVFDVLYNPRPNATTPWKVAAPTLNLGPAPTDFERRSLENEAARCRSLYTERRVLIEPSRKQMVNWELLTTINPQLEVSTPRGAALVFANADSRGVVVSSTSTPIGVPATDPFQALIAAYTMPILVESTG